MILGGIMQRYFALNHNLKLKPSDLHHIAKVMRMKIGDKIEIVYDNDIYLCELSEIKIEDIKFNIINKRHFNNELTWQVTIAVSLVNEQKWDYILQKATELGASEIIPLALSRTIIKINDDKNSKKNERWTNICKEAAEQSHRISIPKVLNIMDINTLVKSDYDIKLVCSTGANTLSLKEVLSKSKKYGKILVVIGPEGGLSKEEEDFLVANHFVRTSLGSFILRVETAPLYVLSAVNYELMR